MPDDPRITEMDPVQKMWMYNNWVADQSDRAELAKNAVYLLASFSHPEAVQQLTGTGANVHITSDEEFEESWDIVKKFKLPKNTDTNNIRRRRGTIKG